MTILTREMPEENIFHGIERPLSAKETKPSSPQQLLPNLMSGNLLKISKVTSLRQTPPVPVSLIFSLEVTTRLKNNTMLA